MLLHVARPLVGEGLSQSYTMQNALLSSTTPPPIRCGLPSLLGLAPLLRHCATLDLRGDILASYPVVSDGGNGTVSLSPNATLSLLLDALQTTTGTTDATNDAASGGIRHLLLSGSPVSVHDAAVATALAPALRRSAVSTLNLDDCNLTSIGAKGIADALLGALVVLLVEGLGDVLLLGGLLLGSVGARDAIAIDGLLLAGALARLAAHAEPILGGDWRRRCRL